MFGFEIKNNEYHNIMIFIIKVFKKNYFILNKKTNLFKLQLAIDLK